MAGFGRRFRVEMLKYAANQTPAASPTTISAGFSTADPGDAAATIASLRLRRCASRCANMS